MVNQDEVEILLNKSLEIINNSHWGDLTLEEISEIKDIEKRKEYRRRWEFCHKHIINPLYSSIKDSKFNFSNSDQYLTCRNMLKDIMDYYYKKGYSKKEIVDIALERDNKKKH